MTPTSPTTLSIATRQQSTERSTLVSVDVNCLLSAGQITAGLWSHSQSLMAGRLHTLSGLIADGIVFIANRNNRKGPDENHQYGHARYENAASLGLRLLLITAGADMIWAAVKSLRSPQGPAPVHDPALVVTLITLAVKEGLFRYMLAMTKRINLRVLIASTRHMCSDAVSPLIAAVGVVSSLMGYHWLNPVAAYIVGLVTGRVGVRFEQEALNDLMDRALPPMQMEAIRANLEATPGVMNVHDLRARVTSDQVLVDAHIEVDPCVSVSEGHAITVRIYANVLTVHTAMVVLDVQTHVDPREHIVTGPVPPSDRSTLHTMLTQLPPPGMPLGARHCMPHYVGGAVEVDLVLPPALAGELARVTDAVNARWDGLVRLRVLVTDT